MLRMKTTTAEGGKEGHLWQSESSKERLERSFATFLPENLQSFYILQPSSPGYHNI